MPPHIKLTCCQLLTVSLNHKKKVTKEYTNTPAQMTEAETDHTRKIVNFSQKRLNVSTL